MITRRKAIGLMGAASAAATLSIPHVARAATGRVVIIGGGFGGATAAKYLKRRSPDLSVTLIEPAERFYTCQFSNLYLAGVWDFEAVGQSYDVLRSQFGVEVVHAMADDVDTTARNVRLSTGETLPTTRWCFRRGSTSAGARLRGMTRRLPRRRLMPGRPGRKPGCSGPSSKRCRTAARS